MIPFQEVKVGEEFYMDTYWWLKISTTSDKNLETLKERQIPKWRKCRY